MTINKPRAERAPMQSHDETGARFTHVYLTATEMLQDSKRARVRVASMLRDRDDQYIIADEIEKKLGVKVPSGYENYLVGEFVEKCALGDFLDLFSIIAANSRRLGNDFVNNFIATSQRIFSEERLRYVINSKGGVRFSADVAFEANMQSTIRNLSRPEFKGAAAAYDSCLKDLAGAPPDCKAAIRNIFEAVEIIFKMLHPGVPRIGEAEIKQKLIPMLDAIGDPTARKASGKAALSLADWVNAAHFYRHGQVSEEPVQPPFSLAVLLVDQGGSFLRWLAELHVGQGQS